MREPKKTSVGFTAGEKPAIRAGARDAAKSVAQPSAGRATSLEAGHGGVGLGGRKVVTGKGGSHK